MNCINCEVEIPEGSYLTMCQTCFRETLGKRVREVWVNYCLKIGDNKPSHIASWEKLNEHDKEVDREIGEELFLLGTQNNELLLSLLKEVTQTLLIVVSDLTDSEKVADKMAWFHFLDRWKELSEEIKDIFSKYQMTNFYENVYQEVVAE